MDDSHSPGLIKSKRTPPSRAGKGPTPASWRSGQSGNRSGRPAGFAGVARQILEKTQDATELVDWALDVWRDKTRPHAERAAAHQWLSDRCLGRPMASAELTVHAGDAPQVDTAVILGRLSEEALRELMAAHDAMLLEVGEG